MDIPVSSLFRLAVSHKSIAWGSSAVVHAIGALVASATFVSTLSDVRARLPGEITRVELRATWIRPERQDQKETSPLEARILITPDRAEIAQQRFSQADTDVSRPTQTELAMVRRMMTPPAHLSRRNPTDGPEHSPTAEIPPASRPGRRPRSIDVATLAVEQPASAGQQASVGAGNQTPPRLLNNRPPTYPMAAVVNHQEGTVLLRVRITAEGDVGGVEIILSSGHPILDAAAAGAVRTWHFLPAHRGRRPVPATVRLPVRFSLD